MSEHERRSFALRIVAVAAVSLGSFVAAGWWAPTIPLGVILGYALARAHRGRP